MPRRHKSWLGWKHVVCQFTLWCSHPREQNLLLYDSKSWLWFKFWNASLLWLTKLTSVSSYVTLIINQGVYSDALMIMKQSKTRLVTTSCASHDLNFCWRMQLRKIHRQWQVLYNPFPLFKYSGKLKTDEKNSASEHNISYYLLCKIHGTTIYNTLAWLACFNYWFWKHSSQ